jgi:hypothetical protein
MPGATISDQFALEHHRLRTAECAAVLATFVRIEAFDRQASIG